MDSQPKQLPAPLFYPVLCWSAGIALGKWLDVPGWWALGASAGLIGLALAFRQIRVVCILLICLCLGAARFAVSQRPTLLDAAFASRDRIVNKAEFTVKQQLSRSGGIFEIELRQVQGMRIDEPLMLFSQTELVPGQRYSAYLEILPGKRDPVLDTFRPLHRAYIRKSLRELPGERPLLPIASWRASLLRVLDERMGPDADFAKALTLSDTAGKGQYRDSLTRSGMIHLIVVSGLHIWFIYWVCMMLLNVLFPRPLAEAVFMLLIGLYAALNHWSPPVLRSVLMIGLMIFARWRSIPLSGAQLLALSLLIITAISPAQLFDVGLQLSFLCVGVIMLGLPRRAWIKERDLPSDILRSRLNRGIDYLVMNTAVGLAVMPLTLYYFGTASLNGIIGNILGVPLSGVLLVLCFIVMILPTNNLLGAAYLTSYRLLLRIFEGWTDLVGSLPFYLDNCRLTAVQVLGCGLLLVCLLRMLRLWAFLPRLLPAILLACLLIALPGFLNQTAAGVYLFNAGTADCILIRLEDGSNLLVDTGPKHRSSEKSWAARKLIPWLGRKGVNSLDWLILTHLDSDHSGGFADLCSALTVKNIAITDETRDDPLWQAWRDTGLLDASELRCIEDTVSVWVGGARIKFLHPDASYWSEADNDLSLVFRLDYKGRRYLFTGDAQVSAERHMLEAYPEELKADYLKAGHHGSRSSSSEEFVRAVSPREVWITAAEGNRWNFPHPEPLRVFQRYASSIRSTAGGTIVVPWQ